MEARKLKPLLPQGDILLKVNADKRYVANGEYILRQIVGDHVLVYTGDRNSFGNSMLMLNETYTFLWQLYQTPKILSEVLEKAHQEYDDPDGVMDEHIRNFLYQGVQFGLLLEV